MIKYKVLQRKVSLSTILMKSTKELQHLILQGEGFTK